MAGFMAALVWHWGNLRLDPPQKGARVPLVRHHLILGGASTEILDLIAQFVDCGDMVTYRTPDFFAHASVVFVLKNDCAPPCFSRKQFSSIEGSSELWD